MQAKDDYLMKFLSQNNVQFEIPVYQRNYDWGEEHCRQLLEDINNCIENNQDSYFIGSIVHIQERGPMTVTGVNKVIIIDGQQRITTINLLLLAIAHTLGDDPSVQPIFNTYLLNPNLEGETKVKLKPIKNDQAAFADIMNGKKSNQASTVGRNYKLFKNLFEANAYDPKKMLAGLGRLKVVEVALEVGKDNPQLIFESLNSTGLNLKSSDLVRNFILMKLDSKKQEEYYQKYWTEIEKNCAYQTEDFIIHYLMIKDKKKSPKNLVYKSFKNYVFKHENIETEELLKSLLEFSRYYSQIWGHNEEVETKSPQVKDALQNIRLINPSPASSYLMSLIHDHEFGDLSEETTARAIELCEAYMIRRSLCEIPSSSLPRTFLSLHRETKRIGEDWRENYLNYLMYNYSKKSNKGRFPKDSELSSALLERDFFHLTPITRNYVFNALENKGKKEKTNIYEGIIDNTLSVEHILPQTLSKSWKDALGEDHKSIHDKYLHTIGNLTITGFNSKISNKSFSEKKEQAFSESPFWLNEFVKKQENWTPKEIESRTKVLTDRALELWPDVDRDLNYDSHNYEHHLMSEPVDVKYTVPVALEVDGSEFKVDTYREISVAYLNYLYQKDPTKLFKIQEIEKFNRIIITEDPSQLKSPLEVTEGVYTEGWLSATGHVKRIIKTAPYYDIDLEQVVITTYKERKKKFKIGKKAA